MDNLVQVICKKWTENNTDEQKQRSTSRPSRKEGSVFFISVIEASPCILHEFSLYERTIQAYHVV